MANNNILFNSAFAGAISAISSRWITSLTGAQYQNQILAAQAYATKVDELIPTNPAYGAKEARLLESISHAFWNDRDPKFTTAAEYLAAAGPVVTLWTQSLTVLLPEPSGAGGDLPLVDGSQAAPSLSFLSDLSLGMWYKNASTAGWAVGNENIYDIGNDTIVNLDPISPATVRYAMRGYSLPIAGVNESTFFYQRLTYTAPESARAAIYLEIDDSQVDTYGAAIKVIHDGHGDAMYVSLFSDGVAFESASFFDGSRGIISTLQIDAPNAVLFNALWEQPSVPNLGMYLADAAMGGAFVVRKRNGAADGVAQWIIMEENALANRRRLQAFNDGALQQNALVASAGTPIRDSPEFRQQGSYWDGAVTRDIGYTFKTVVTGANVAEWRLFEVAPAGSTLLLIVRRNGSVGQVDMQNGTIINVDTLNGTGANPLDLVSNGQTSAQLDAAGGVDGETALLVATKTAGVYTLKRVSYGAADSGGAGFRLLRVAN